MPPLNKLILTGIILASLGWSGLAILVIFTLPTIAPRWLFFFLFMLALSGTALPAAAFLNRRFPSNPPVGSDIILRQATWVGIYGCLLVWLQLGRVLNLALALFLVVGFGLIEFLLRLRERSSWKPGEAADE